MKKNVKWLINNHHGINWNAGATSLADFKDIIITITNSSNLIYVKGREKANYLRKFTEKQVLELDEHPALRKSQPKCSNHFKTPCKCALTNVLNLYDIFIKNTKLSL